MMNRLANETSPYLLQHKDNPVNWYPWSNEAFSHAKRENKPILLSVGYSACHWCHVMAHESFEDANIAQLMNTLFVNVKVDREERPDIDLIYMKAVQAMTGQGGWPMTVFLLPDGSPFFAGTYFPPDDRGSMIGFKRLLNIIHEAFENRRGDVQNTANSVVEAIKRETQRGQAAEIKLDDALFGHATEIFIKAADTVQGGFGSNIKFPQPVAWEYLLSSMHANDDVESEHIAQLLNLTLTKMAHGGIYDQLGGGFARYATDRNWLVPHFEKMLYDNAQLCRLYCEVWQVSAQPLFKQITEGIGEYILQNLTHSNGGFFAAQDADSEGEEGKYYIWDYTEFVDCVGKQDAEIACRYWGVTPDGNYEGKNVLTLNCTIAELASEIGSSPSEAEQRIHQAHLKLLKMRQLRVQPGLDSKIITAWNALTMDALAYAGMVMDKPEWVAAAERNAKFILNNLIDTKTGRLHRIWNQNSKGLAYLEDYAMLINGLLSLYQATYTTRFLMVADFLTQSMVNLFWSADDGLFYDSGNDQEALIVRPRDIYDSAMPSGSSVALGVLWRTSAFTGGTKYIDIASQALQSVAQLLSREPLAVPNWLRVAKCYADGAEQVVLVGNKDDTTLQKMLKIATAQYAPKRVVLVKYTDDDTAKIPIFNAKTEINGKATAYVCYNNVCDKPTNSISELGEMLR